MRAEPRDFDLDEAARAHLLRWAAASGAGAAGRAARAARADLAAAELVVLRAAMAALAAAVLEALLARPVDLEGPEVEVAGVRLSAGHAALLSAWLDEQAATAEALGTDPDRWLAQIAAPHLGGAPHPETDRNDLARVLGRLTEPLPTDRAPPQGGRSWIGLRASNAHDEKGTR